MLYATTYGSRYLHSPTRCKGVSDAKQHATEVLKDLQHFFADEMNQRGHGHGPKTFEIARDADNDLLFDKKHSSIEKVQFQAIPIKACKHELSGGRPCDADIELCFLRLLNRKWSGVCPRRPKQDAAAATSIVCI